MKLRGTPRFARRIAVVAAMSIGLLSLAASGTPATATPTPTPIDLGTLGGTSSYAQAVSGNIVVGSSDTTDDGTHAVAWDLGEDPPSMLDLGTLGTGKHSQAVAVSGNIVVGWSTTEELGFGEFGDDLSWATRHAFAYDLGGPGPMIDLGTVGGSFSEATSVSGNIVVGYSSTAGDLSVHAFAYDLGGAGPMIDLDPLGGLSSSAAAVSGNIVVGSRGGHAFVSDLGEDPPSMHEVSHEGLQGSAVAVSGDVVVGAADFGDGRAHAFAYDLGATPPSMLDLGTFGFSQSTADAVSGDIVVGTLGGFFCDASGCSEEVTHPFAYDLGAASDPMKDLGHLGGGGQARAVSGNIVVGYSALASGIPHAFAYDLGAASPVMQDLGTLGGMDSYAMAVDGTVVVGHSSIEDDAATHATAWILLPSTNPDSDGDGVADTVDSGDGAFTDPISGSPDTTGSIVSLPAGFSILIDDAVDPEGVRVRVEGTGSDEAVLSVCGGFTIQVGAGSEVVITCGSVIARVVAGTAEVALNGGSTIVRVTEGSTAVVAAVGSGFTVENQGGTGAVTVITNGVETNVPPGPAVPIDMTGPSINISGVLELHRRSGRGDHLHRNRPVRRRVVDVPVTGERGPCTHSRWARTPRRQAPPTGPGTHRPARRPSR